jgi:hypothetical protein
MDKQPELRNEYLDGVDRGLVEGYKNGYDAGFAAAQAWTPIEQWHADVDSPVLIQNALGRISFGNATGTGYWLDEHGDVIYKPVAYQLFPPPFKPEVQP